MVAPTPFFTEGGCSYRILGEARSLVRYGLPVSLLTYPSGRDMPGIPTVRPHYSERKMGIGMNPVRPFYDLELLRLLLKRDTGEGYLHVHLHEGGIFGLLEKVLRKRRFLLDLEGSLTEEVSRTLPFIGKGYIGNLGRRLEALLESSASEVIVSSSGLYEALTRAGHIPSDKLHLVPDGVDTQDFVPRHLMSEDERMRWRKLYGLSREDVVAVHVGAISPEQGIDDLLEMAPSMISQAPNLRFMIFGIVSGSNSLKAYVAKAKELGLERQVSFPGMLPFEQVPFILASSDIGLTWKNAFLEGSGKIPLYMAAGLPIVALQTPAHAYYLGNDESRGGIISPDRKDAAQTVVKLALNPDRRVELGRRAREVAERELSWDIVAKKLVQLHESIARETVH
jgi:glycosyltransferase involved in cell wall biosynthesis